MFIELAEGAKEYLAEKGYDPAFGARPLKRLIAKEVADRLAIELLQGSFGSGDTIEVDAEAGRLVFRRQQPAPADALAGSAAV
jgi:ATP-dependent Clp protease ATP-binding subunit ClpB